MQSYIPCSGRRPERPQVWRKVGLVLLAGICLGQAVKAQCVGSQASQTYDTALTSNGFGIYTLHFPQFNPDSGTLMSVRLTALTNSLYGFTLRNADSLAATYTLTVGEQDDFSGPSLPAPYSNVTSQPMGDYPLNADQSVTQAPVSFLQDHLSTDSVTAVTPFLGTGRVNLRYQAFTFTNLSTVNNASYYYSAGISNTMTVSVQYLYCRAGGTILATDLTGWSAMPVGLRNVQLNWSASDEVAGRQYVIQRGSSAENFTNIATLPATADGNMASYSYPDELPENADSNWYYRLQIQDVTGQTSYSSIKEISLENGKGLQLYPNPATSFINLVPDLPEATDWQVDIISVNGNLVQRDVVMQAHTIQINFRSKLAGGTYFVRATDLRGQRIYSNMFIVP